MWSRRGDLSGQRPSPVVSAGLGCLGNARAAGAVAARPELGRDQAARLMGITGSPPGSLPGPDGYAREHEAQGEVGGRGGAARPQVSPAREDMYPPVLDARGGALEQLLGVEVVVAPADDQGGGRDARQAGFHIEGVLDVQG